MDLSSARMTVDLSALRANYTAFQRDVGQNCSVAGIVKADAYGIGAAQVARVLAGSGCRQFFVATLEEGLALRPVLDAACTSGAGRIAVLGGLCVGSEKEFINNKLTPVLNALDEARRWARHAPGSPAILHVDTGMSRLGLDGPETERLLADPSLLCGVPLAAIMSHLACADEPDHPMTEAQRLRFERIVGHFPGVPRSLANSAGLFLGPRYHFEMVRPGIALYGGAPLAGQANPVRPVIRLEAPVLQVRAVRRGETVGYSATHRFDRDGFCITVGLGYADGLPRTLSGRGRMFWNARPLPIAGRVSMDLVTLDATALPESSLPQPGDFLEVIGPNQSLDVLAGDAGTISYEILTRMGARYRRIWNESSLDLSQNGDLQKVEGQAA